MYGRNARGAAKKLAAAARFWAKPGAGSGKADDEDENADVISAWLGEDTAKPRETVIELAPDDIEPFALFCALQTQWRFHPATGERMGIDYSAIAPTAQAAKIEMTPEIFNDVRVMEGAALKAFASKL